MPPRKLPDDSDTFAGYGDTLIALKADFRAMRDDIHELKDLLKNSTIQIRALEDFKLRLETEQKQAAKDQHERSKRFALNLSLGVGLAEVGWHAFEWYMGHK